MKHFQEDFTSVAHYALKLELFPQIYKALTMQQPTVANSENTRKEDLLLELVRALARQQARQDHDKENEMGRNKR